MNDISRIRRGYRARRRGRIARKVRGTTDRPRLVVFRSLKNVEGQLVDDDRAATILSVNTRASDLEQPAAEEGETPRSGKVAASYAAGLTLAKRAREQGIDSVVFDRGGYPYHGRVKAFAEGARAGGLRF